MITREKVIPLATIIISVILALIIHISGTNRDIFLFVNRHLSFMGGTFWINVTNFGDGFLTFFILLPLTVKNKKILTDYLITGIFVSVIVVIVKNHFGIARPPKIIPHEDFFIFGKTLYENSFPSGHSATIAVTLGAVIFNTKNIFKQSLVLLSIITVGVSRIAVGAHWPIDVLTAFTIAFSTLWIVSYLTKNLNYIITDRVYKIIYILSLPIFLTTIIFYKSEYPGAIWSQRFFIFAFYTSMLYLHRIEYYKKGNNNAVTETKK